MKEIDQTMRGIRQQFGTSSQAGAQPPPIAPRMPEIREQVEALEAQINIMEAALSGFGGRIQTVLRYPVPESEGSTDKIEREPCCDLASKLQRHVFELRRLTALVNDLSDRVEL